MQIWKTMLAYDGAPFHGWQIQPGLPTIQGTLASALHRITGETVLPQGSGRTDTGVHALGQVASFALAAPIPPASLHRALNRALPPAIRVLSAEHAPENFHARHSAQRKTYEYRIYHRPPPPGCPMISGGKAEGYRGRDLLPPAPDRICPPMLAPYVWDLPFPFDPERAREAAGHILGEHDFTSFAAADPDRSARLSGAEASNIRTIFASGWTLDSAPESMLIYRVTGSGFLHHMVRNLVGTFAECGMGRLSPALMPQILAARRRGAAGPTAPAHGLFLREVEY